MKACRATPRGWRLRPGSCSRRLCHSARTDGTATGFAAASGAVGAALIAAAGVRVLAGFTAAVGAVVAAFATAAGATAAVFAAFAAARSSARLGVLRTGSLTAFPRCAGTACRKPEWRPPNCSGSIPCAHMRHCHWRRSNESPTFCLLILGRGILHAQATLAMQVTDTQGTGRPAMAAGCGALVPVWVMPTRLGMSVRMISANRRSLAG